MVQHQFVSSSSAVCFLAAWRNLILLNPIHLCPEVCFKVAGRLKEIQNDRLAGTEAGTMTFHRPNFPWKSNQCGKNSAVHSQ